MLLQYAITDGLLLPRHKTNVTRVPSHSMFTQITSPENKPQKAIH